MKPLELELNEPSSKESKPETQANAGEERVPTPCPDTRSRGINPGRRLRAILSGAQRVNSRKARTYWLREKLSPAYWNVTGSLSLLVNAVLIIIVLLMGREIFSLKRQLYTDLAGGMAYNYSLMDQASIQAQVPISLDVPLDMQIPISVATDVTLTRDTPVENAPVIITTGVININNPADIVLPAGTVLPIQLNITVPYQQTLKYVTTATVEIPIAETSLHTPLANMEQLLSSYGGTSSEAPLQWEAIPICKTLHSLCAWWFK